MAVVEDRMGIEFVLLADQPDAVETVAQWYFDQWASSTPGATLDKVKNKLAKSTSRHTAPMVVLARDAGVVIGAAELKLHEMAAFPEYEYWVGGVYVAAQRRGNGIGSQLVKQIISRAINAGIDKLYLQTEALCGGVYVSLGFVPLHRLDYNGRSVLVMTADLTVLAQV